MIVKKLAKTMRMRCGTPRCAGSISMWLMREDGSVLHGYCDACAMRLALDILDGLDK